MIQPDVHEYTAGDGARNGMSVYRSDDQLKGPVIVCLPALGVRAGFYAQFATGLAQACAAAVITADWRGKGMSSLRVTRKHPFGYAEVLHQDLPALIAKVQQLFPGRPCYMLGHSLGGQMALLYASCHHGMLAGVILVAAGSNHYASFSGLNGIKRMLGLRMIRLVTQVLGYFPGETLGFAGTESKNMMLDMTHESLWPTYKVQNGTMPYNQLLTELSLPVLILSLEGDSMVPSTCAQTLANKLKTAAVERRTLLARDHGLERFNHFKWARQPAPVVEAVSGWLAKTTGNNSASS